MILRRKPGFWAAVIGLWCVCFSALALDVPPEHHPWGSFPEGSWSRIRRTTYVPNADGGETIQNVVTVTTRLDKVEADGITLTVEEATDGKESEPVTLKYGWDGLPAEDERTVRLSVGEIKIDGRSYTCQTHETSVKKPGDTTVVKWWYCPDQSPYLLKRVLRTAGNQPRFILQEANGFQKPRDVLGEEHGCTTFRIEENTPARNTLTNAYASSRVPGGTVFTETEVRDRERGQVQRVREEIEAFETPVRKKPAE